MKMIAKMKQTTATGIAHPPKAPFKPGKTKAKTPKAIKSKTAKTKDKIGIYLGKKNVNAILIKPHDMAKMNAHKTVLLNPE
jgi:hypothetical protein